METNAKLSLKVKLFSKEIQFRVLTLQSSLFCSLTPLLYFITFSFRVFLLLSIDVSVFTLTPSDKFHVLGHLLSLFDFPKFFSGGGIIVTNVLWCANFYFYKENKNHNEPKH